MTDNRFALATAEEAMKKLGEIQQDPNAQATATILTASIGIGICVEIVIVVPLTLQLYKRNAMLSSGFFVIFVLGCWMDLIYAVDKIVMELTYYQVLPIQIITNICQWYFLYFITCWNTVLALNRFTALVFIKVYSRVWSKLWLKLICLFLILYPFLVNGYTFFLNTHCRLNTYMPECQGFMLEDMTVMSYTNTAHACGSLIVGVISYGIIKCYQKKSVITKQVANERKLLFFSIFSSTLLILFCFAQIFAAWMTDSEQFVMTRHMVNLLYILWHYPGLLMLFMLSKAFRVEFLRFYHLDGIFRIKPSIYSNNTLFVTTP